MAFLHEKGSKRKQEHCRRLGGSSCARLVRARFFPKSLASADFEESMKALMRQTIRAPSSTSPPKPSHGCAGCGSWPVPSLKKEEQ